MLNGFRVCDADAHAIMSPAMWQDLPEDFIRRRPRAVRIIDDKDLGRWNTGWLIEGGQALGRIGQVETTDGNGAVRLVDVGAGAQFLHDDAGRIGGVGARAENVRFHPPLDKPARVPAP